MIHNGETASWEVDVLLSTEFAGDMSIGWEVGGDGYGGEPHNVTGEIMLEYPLRWINLDTSSGTLAVGESREITVNFDTGDIDEGIHEADVVISSDSWDTKTIRIMLNVTVTDEDENIPIENTALTGNYPNPFNPSTVISYKLAEEREVELTIYNIKGQAVKTLEHKVCPAGEYHVTWDGKTDSGLSAGSGDYFYKLKAGTYTHTKKMILMK